MPDDWNDTLLNIGFAEVDEDDIFGDLDEYGLLPPEADGGDERGQMMVGGGFGNLYYYELHDKKKRVRAKKYAIPVTGGKRGDFKFFVGETAEQAMVKYRKGRASGDVETVSDIVKADTKLKEAHGTMNTDIWHVKVWKSLGPVEAKAPPSQRPSATTVAEAAAALEAAEEEKELLAIEKAFSPSEILKEGKNVVYIVVGIGVVAVIGTVAFLVYRHGTPTGVLTGMLQKRKNPSTPRKRAGTVYAYDQTDGLVKIKKHGKNWLIYPLEEVEVDRHDERTYRFASRARETHDYQPYEKGDVSSSPDTYFDEVERMQHHKVRQRL